MLEKQRLSTANTRIPILMYHEVSIPEKIPALSKKTQYSFILSTTQFESQIKWLHDSGYRPWPMHELISWLSGRPPEGIPTKPIILTFDDGFEGNYRFALPILQKYGFKATFFVIVTRIGKPYMMTWQHLRELDDAGMSVQSHTMTHRILGLFDPDEITRELKTSKQELEQRLSRPVDFISLPFGSYNKQYRKVAIDTGYLGGCTSDFGLIDSNCDHFFLRRIPVKSTQSLMNFSKMIEVNNLFFRKTMLTQNIKKFFKKTVGERHIYNIYNNIFGLKE